MRVIPLDAFRDKIPMARAIAAVERGFKLYGLKQASLPDPLVMTLEERSAEVHVKGAHLTGAPYVVLKLATGFPANRDRGLPSGDGMFLLLDATTGAPVFLLEEHGYLTDLRTAAAIALTLKYCAPPDAKAALVVGAGAVARLASRAILAERPIERVVIWNRTAERAEVLARELKGVVECRVATALEPEVKKHRIIVTATAASEPLIRAAWVAKGTHVVSAGTGSPGKVELEPRLLAKADRLFADRVTQTERYGNLAAGIAAGVVTRDSVTAELGDLAAGRVPGGGRTAPDEITVADLTGVGVQDAAIAEAVVEALAL